MSGSFSDITAPKRFLTPFRSHHQRSAADSFERRSTAEIVGDDLVDQVVGHQLAAGHEWLRLESGGGAAADGVAEHVAGADVGQAQSLAE